MDTVEPLVFMSLWAAAFVLLIVFTGSIVQAGLGMGFGLTVAPVLALVDPIMVPAPALYLGMTTAFLGAWSERQNIVWPEVRTGMLGRATGILIGTIILIYLTDTATFSLVFGIIILIAVGFSVVGLSLALNRTNLLSMGLVSGFTGVITSVGAPPLALIYQNRDSKHARPTLAAFFAFGGALSLTALYGSGLVGSEALKLALFMAPAAVLGTWTGRKLQGKFDKRYRPALLLIASLAAVMLIVRGLG